MQQPLFFYTFSQLVFIASVEYKKCLCMYNIIHTEKVIFITLPGVRNESTLYKNLILCECRKYKFINEALYDD